MRATRTSDCGVLRSIPDHRPPLTPAALDAAAPPNRALGGRRDGERIEFAVAGRVPLLQQVRTHHRERPFRANLGAAVALDRRCNASSPPTRRASAARERAVMRGRSPLVPAVAAKPPDLQP